MNNPARKNVDSVGIVQRQTPQTLDLGLRQLELSPQAASLS